MRCATMLLVSALLVAFALGTLVGCAKDDRTGAAAKPSADAKARLSGERQLAVAADEAGAPAKSPADPDAYYSSTYAGGYGERERMAKLVEEGVLVGGKTVQLAAFTRQYAQDFPIPTDRALSLSATTEHGLVETEGAHTFLQVGLQAMKGEAPRRPPLNIALVVDCSGSMADERKMECARQAAEEVVNRLTERDRLALIAYDDTAEVLVPSKIVGGKDEFLKAIRDLTPGGARNIHVGLEKGFAAVSKRLSNDAGNPVILVSDGNVTAGVQDEASFRKLVRARFEDGIQTTTVGMGLDFNEGLMMTLSREGKGNYHFVRDADAVAAVFERELEDLTHVVAKAVYIRVELDPSVTLVRVLGSRELDEGETAAVREDERTIDRQVYEDLGITRDRQTDPDERGVKMVLPHFYLGDSHVLLLEVDVPAGNRDAKIADVHVKYKDVVFAKNREESASVSVGRAESKSEMVASTVRSVRKNRLGYQTGEALLAAAECLGRGDTAGAAMLIDERMTQLGLAAEEWEDADVNADHELLGRYQEVLASLGRVDGSHDELGRYLAKSMTYSGWELTR